MSPAEPITDHGPMLQVLVVTCDGVEYMFFGPPIMLPDPDSGLPAIESLAFSGLMPSSELVKLLQRTKSKDFLSAPNVQ